MAKSTKPKGATSFKETAFGILPRSKIIPLEAEGIKKALQYIIQHYSKIAVLVKNLCDDLEERLKHSVSFVSFSLEMIL